MPCEVRLALLDERGDALQPVLAGEAAAEAFGLPPEPLLEREVSCRSGELQYRGASISINYSVKVYFLIFAKKKFGCE